MNPTTQKYLVYAGAAVLALYIVNNITTETSNTIGAVGIFAIGAGAGVAGALLLPVLLA